MPKEIFYVIKKKKRGKKSFKEFNVQAKRQIRKELKTVFNSPFFFFLSFSIFSILPSRIRFKNCFLQLCLDNSKLNTIETCFGVNFYFYFIFFVPVFLILENEKSNEVLFNI